MWKINKNRFKTKHEAKKAQSIKSGNNFLDKVHINIHTRSREEDSC
jgi:hypothetical protein